MRNLEQESNLQTAEFSRRRKPSGRKNENRERKLPNHVRHDQNAAIAVGTWKKRNGKLR